MILIADSGSTKTDWCLVDDNQESTIIKTKGTNPFFQSEDEIVTELQTALVPALPSTDIESVYFYGAGCTQEKLPVLERALGRVLHIAQRCEVATDMLAAARSLFGHQAGIACILGTGSNSCLYNGEQITHNVSPLGFMLGDEGSGAVLGKTLIGDILKAQLPERIIKDFNAQYHLTAAQIIEQVYRQPLPNRFLASFVPFLQQHLDEPSIYALVVENFRRFLCRNVKQYEGWDRLPIGFIGSVAYYFRHPLNDALELEGMTMGKIIQTPLDGLVTFHSHKPLPPITEQSSLYDDLEKMSTHDLLTSINTEDKKVALAVEKALPHIEALIDEIVPRMKAGGRIFYMGAGTSGRLGVLDASELPPTFGVPPTMVIGLIAGGDTALRNAVENAEDDTDKGWEELLAHHITDKDTVIGIAASGTTPYVVGALKKAKSHGILTGCITSNPGTKMAAVADHAIEMIVGPEFVTGSSRMKSGTGQKMILNMISTSVMIKLGRVKGNRMVNMQLTNKKLVDRGTRMLVDALGVDYEHANRLLLLYGSVEKAIEGVSHQ